MKITIPTDTIYRRHLNDMVRADVKRIRAVQEYNIMMGHIDDPTEYEEGEQNEET